MASCTCVCTSEHRPLRRLDRTNLTPSACLVSLVCSFFPSPSSLPPPCLFCLCPRPLFFLFSSEDNRLGDVIFLRHYCKAAARHMPLGSAEGEGCSAAAPAHTTSAISWWRDGTECTQTEREREREKEGYWCFFFSS